MLSNYFITNSMESVLSLIYNQYEKLDRKEVCNITAWAEYCKYRVLIKDFGKISSSYIGFRGE